MSSTKDTTDFLKYGELDSADTLTYTQNHCQEESGIWKLQKLIDTYLIQVKQKYMSGKSQRDLVLKEAIHIVLHGHTIQQWTLLRYMIDTGFVHVSNIDVAKGNEVETFSVFSARLFPLLSFLWI